jgi:hypothetical protein
MHHGLFEYNQVDLRLFAPNAPMTIGTLTIANFAHNLALLGRYKLSNFVGCKKTIKSNAGKGLDKAGMTLQQRVAGLF